MISPILFMGNLRLRMAKETQLKSWELGLKLKLSLKSKSTSICPSFHSYMAFSGGTSGKEPACQCRRHRDVGLIPGLGRSPGGGHGNPFQYYCLENPTDRGAWWATVYRVAKIWTWLKQLSMQEQWRLMYRNFESLCFIHETNIMF